MRTQQQLPAGYRISKDLIATSRWVVSYQGDPYFFVEKSGTSGQEHIKTFKTKSAAILAIEEHITMINRLESLRRR